MRLLGLSLAFICILFLKTEATEESNKVSCLDVNDLPCNDGQCIRRQHWCDDRTDCYDQSDENYCRKKGWSIFANTDPNDCKNTHFLCDDGRCFPRAIKCDGHSDCSNGDDEKDCEPENFDDYDDYHNSQMTTYSVSEATITDASPKADYFNHDGLHSKTTSTTTRATTEAPISVSTQGATLISSTKNFYSRRLEEENGRTDSQSRAQVPSYLSSTTTVETTTTPEPKRRESQGARQAITTSRPLPSTESPTRSLDSRRHQDPSPTPFVQFTRQYDPRRVPDQSLTSTIHLPRAYDSRNYNVQSHTIIPHSTRSYVAGQNHNLPHATTVDPNRFHIQPTRAYDPRRDPQQYHTQPTRTYDPRRDPQQYRTQPTRTYDPRRDPRKPQQYPTQPTRASDPRRDPYENRTPPTRTHDSRRNPDQYHSQPTRSYVSRRDPYESPTQPTRGYDSRREVNQYTTQSFDFRSYTFPSPAPPLLPRRQTHYPYDTTRATVIHSVMHRFYHDRENYYDGYYDQNGRFVVVHTNYRQQDNRQQEYREQPYPETSRQTRQEPELPATVLVPFERQIKAPSRFYFAKNYTRIYGEKNTSYLRRGGEWLLSIRNATGGWGKETPRALVALSLLNNSFVNETYENDVMQKYFQVYLGTRLLRGEAETTTLNRLAMSVHALLATCQDPRNFHGTDLTDLIRRGAKELNRRNHRGVVQGTRIESVNPLVYLSLCLAGRDLDQYEEHDLMTRLGTNSTPDEYARDMLSLSISAFACHMQQQRFLDSENHRSMHSMLINATTRLLQRLRHDGSFGSVYGTALAAQALLSVNETMHWNPEATFDFLKKQQKSDGSFGDFLATYLTLPVLSGRSLVHLRNTQCTPPKSDRVLSPSEILAYPGPKQHIRYSLYFGHPKVNGRSIEVLVPHGISFFDVMRVAQYENDDFKFSYEERNGQINVYSISNVPNDSEQGFAWHLYVKSNSDLDLNKPNAQEQITGDIREFYPTFDQHAIFWYHTSGIQH